MKKAITSILPFLFTLQLYSQLNLSWSWYNSPDWVFNSAFFFQQSGTGNFITAGESNGSQNIYSVDATGALQQTFINHIPGVGVKSISGFGNLSGEMYFLNSIYNASPDSSEVMKMSLNFQPLWRLTFPFETPVGFAMDQNQDLIMLSDSDKVILRKISPSGNIMWAIVNDSASGSDHLKIKKLKLDKTGNIYVLSEKKIAGDYQYSLKKFWNNGAFAWEVNYNPTPNQDIPHDLFVDDSCRIYITGESYITSNGSQRGYASEKVDSSGAVIWTDNYSTHSNVGWRIMSDHAGNAYVAGSTIETGNLHYIRILKYDPDGDTVWTYSADSAAFVSQIQFTTLGLLVDSAGNTYFTYPRVWLSYTMNYFYLEKISTNGQLINTYIEPWGKYLGNYIIETAYHQILVAGDYAAQGGSSPGPYYLFIFAIDDMTGIQDFPENSDAIILYPNPSNGIFILSGNFSLSTRIEVYDILGQELSSEEIPMGSQTINLHYEFPPGVYSYRIVSDNRELKTGKLIISK